MRPWTILFCIGWLLGAFAVQYDLEFWMTFLKGHAVFVPLLPCFVGALIFGWPAVMIAVFTWMFSLAT